MMDAEDLAEEEEGEFEIIKGDKLKIKILEKNDNEIKFILNANPQFANALRRIMMKEIPVLAIDTVDFYYNDSILFNENIAQRLGLIPLTFDPKIMNLPDECKCKNKGCSLCQVVLVLDKKVPGMIYAKDFKSTDKSVQPVFLETPIIELFKNQKLKLEATAILGKGIDHAKWQAAIAHYNYYPVLEKSPIKNLEAYVNICPVNALKIEKGKLILNEKCNLCGECFKLGDIKIKGDENKFIFNVETVSGLKPEEIILKSIEILETKTKEFEKEIKKIK